MKKINSISLMIALTAGLFACTGQEGHLADGIGDNASNAIYMHNKNASGSFSVLSTQADGAKFVIQPRIASIADRDVKVTVKVDNATLEAYNKANNLSLQPIALEDITLTDADGNKATNGVITTVVKAGDVIANITGHVATLDPEKYPSNGRYAVAFKLLPTDSEEMPMLSSPTTTIVTIDRQIVTSAMSIQDLKKGFVVSLTEPLKEDLNEWTFQMQCYFYGLGRNDLQVASPNQTMANISGDGIKGPWYTRISESGGMQLKAGRDGADTWTNKPLQTKKWLQLTFVHKASGLAGVTSFYCNGVLQKTWFNTPAYRWTAGGKNQKWGIAGSGNWRDGDMIREVRFWNRAFSEAEIRDKLYLPEDPKAEGLIFYVPLSKETFDEATGTFRELTGKASVEMNGGQGCKIGTNINFVENILFPSEDLKIMETAPTTQP